MSDMCDCTRMARHGMAFISWWNVQRCGNHFSAIDLYVCMRVWVSEFVYKTSCWVNNTIKFYLENICNVCVSRAYDYSSISFVWVCAVSMDAWPQINETLYQIITISNEISNWNKLRNGGFTGRCGFKIHQTNINPKVGFMDWIYLSNGSVRKIDGAKRKGEKSKEKNWVVKRHTRNTNNWISM